MPLDTLCPAKSFSPVIFGMLHQHLGLVSMITVIIVLGFLVARRRDNDGFEA
jgi:hypothetical protein